MYLGGLCALHEMLNCTVAPMSLHLLGSAWFSGLITGLSPCSGTCLILGSAEIAQMSSILMLSDLASWVCIDTSAFTT
jgi:hypothetical protein